MPVIVVAIAWVHCEIVPSRMVDGVRCSAALDKVGLRDRPKISPKRPRRSGMYCTRISDISIRSAAAGVRDLAWCTVVSWITVTL